MEASPTFLVKMVMLLLSLLLLLGRSAATRDVWFVTVAGHTPTTYMAATAAELLRSSRNEGQEDVSARLVTFSSSGHIASKYLDPSQITYFESRTTWTTTAESKAKVAILIGESNLKGIPRLLLEGARYYEQEVQELKELIKQKTPDLLVIDMFATSAIDLADHLQLPYMIFYHCGVFGILGIEDTFGMPDSLTGTDLSQQSLMTRIKKVFNLLRLIVGTSESNAIMNKARSRLGLRTYEDPSTNILRHPIIATTVFGLEYPRPVSPLTRLVGMFTNPAVEPSSIAPGSQDASALEWLSSSSKSALFASFGTEAYPTLAHFQAVLEGGRAAGLRVLLLVRQDILDHYSLQPQDLTPAGSPPGDVLILTWLTAVPNILSHPAVQALVCHGGIQSTAEGIYAELPLIMLPANADRNAISARVTDLGIGVHLDQHTLTAKDVSDAIAKVAEPGFAASAKEKMRWLKKVNSFAGSGSVGAAAYIREVLEVGYQHLVPITLDMSPVAVHGMDAIALLMGLLLLAGYLLLRLLLGLLGCGRKGAKAKRD